MSLGVRVTRSGAAAQRRFFSTSKRAQATAAMNTAFPGVPETSAAAPQAAAVESVKLANGMTLVAVNTPGSVTGMSLFVKAGSRYEYQQDAGSAHFLKRYAFRNTEKKYFLQLVRDVDVRGSTFTSTACRENVGYHVTGLTAFKENMAETLGAVAEPLIEEYLVDRVRPEVEAEVSAFKADAQATLVDALHFEAFRDQQLAASSVAPQYQVGRITDHNLRKHTSTYYTPDRMTVVASGTDLKTLQALVEANFKPTDLRAMVREYLGANSGVEEDIVGPLKAAHTPLVASGSKFAAGGEVRIAGAGHAHVALGFEGAAKNSKEVAALAVLQQILGGYSSSTFGLASGVRQSLLGQNVVAANEWVHQASAFNLSYADAGLFGVYGEASQGKAGALLEALYKQVQATASVSDADVMRGKALAKSALLAQTESSRASLNAFLAQQAQAGAQVVLTPSAYLKNIDAVTVADIQAAAKKLLSVKPVVAACGDVKGLPRL